jgi:hypothetical protein
MSRHAIRVSLLTLLLCAASILEFQGVYGAEDARDDEASARKACADKMRQTDNIAFSKDKISLPGADSAADEEL